MARPNSAEARGPEADGSTAPYTHNSGSQQGKGENTANPRNGGTICPTLLIGHKACQSLIKNTFLSTHTHTRSQTQMTVLCHQ